MFADKDKMLTFCFYKHHNLFVEVKEKLRSFTIN